MLVFEGFFTPLLTPINFAFQRVYTEMQGALEKWASSGRWDTIMLAGLRDKAPPTVFDQIIGGDLPSNKVVALEIDATVPTEDAAAFAILLLQC